MGKVKKQRKVKEQLDKTPENDIFEQIREISALKSELFDDNKSIKSMKSIKQNMGITTITKKNKLKLKKTVLLKKISLSNKMNLKKRSKKTDVKKNFNDSLPGLSSLLVEAHSKIKVAEPTVTKKSIQNVSRRKKNLVDGVKVYKKVLKDKTFLDNPLQSVLEQVKQRLENKEL